MNIKIKNNLKAVYRIAGAFLAIAALSLIGTLASGATTANAAAPCPVPTDNWEIRNLISQYMTWTFDLQTGKATVTNNHPTCAYQFTLLVFKVVSENSQVGQVIYNVDTQVVPVGGTSSFSVAVPPCRYQLDLVFGPRGNWTPAKQLAGDITYNLPICPGTPPPPSNPPLRVSCTGSPNPANVNQAVTWTASSTGATGVYTYSWTGNGSFPTGATGNPVTAVYTGAGVKNANVTVRSGNMTATASCSINVVTLPPPPQPPSCSPVTQQGSVNQQVSLNATGGNGVYTWSTSGGLPNNGNGRTFNTIYSTPGTKTVTVTSNGLSDQCTVIIERPPVVGIPPSCSPSSQNANIGESVNLRALGGNGAYSWSVSGGNPSTGNGSSFNTSFSTSGTKVVTVTSGGLTDQCIVNVRTIVVETPPSCSPVDQEVNVGETASLVANGGNGIYSWSVSGGNPSTGNGANFNTSFSTAGTRTVTLTSNGRTAQCQVRVRQVQIQAPVCNPASQTANVGNSVNFSATGGNGIYSWSAGTGSPTGGSGSNFNSIFNTPGTHVVTVTSNGLSDQCTVNIQPIITQNLNCSASVSVANIGNYVSFNATGGNGVYNWNAYSGNPVTGGGQTFTTQFNSQGTQTVTVTSGNQVATCNVVIQPNTFPQPPSCSPSVQNANVNQQVTFYGNGGTGNYSWNSSNGLPAYGYGSSFATSFSTPGTWTVTLNSNGQTAQCIVNVQQTFNNAPVCTPSVQNANVNDFVTFNVSGGNGTYFWNTTADGSPTTGNGNSFGTRFTTAGTKIVTVNSNGQTSQCVVQIGSVLGASTVVTGPTETAAAAAGIGLLGSLIAYGAIFRPKKLLSLLRLGR